jgi:hypothetical protein
MLRADGRGAPLAAQVAKGSGPKIYFLILLKTFQRLGYFARLYDVPRPIAEHVSLLFGVHFDALEWDAYDESGAWRRHVAAISEHLVIKPYDQTAQRGHPFKLEYSTGNSESDKVPWST